MQSHLREEQAKTYISKLVKMLTVQNIPLSKSESGERCELRYSLKKQVWAVMDLGFLALKDPQYGEPTKDREGL